MEKMRAAVIAVCSTAAVKCIVDSLAAGTRLKEPMARLTELLMAVVLIGSVIGAIGHFSLPELTTCELPEGMTGVYSDALAERTARNIEAVLMEQLTAAGIECSEICAEINISEDCRISITKVTVRAADPESAAGMIRSTLGEETEVTEIVDE